MDPSDWHGYTDYKVVAELVLAAKVTNDVAERGVALMQNVYNVLTKHESQKQNLLEVVEQHRRTFQNANKTMLAD